MTSGWIVALGIMIGCILFLGLCFGLMYSIGWLVKRRHDENSKGDKK